MQYLLPDQLKLYIIEKMAMPTMQLTLTFCNLNYYVDTPPEMLKQGCTTRRLQLLNNVTGAFRPGVLSALMGVSGAGKTTLLDVLAGRKTGGYIEGDIRIGGYPKVQETFVRILGYCEQVDIHSPQLTVEESVTYSAWLRLPSNVNEKTRFLILMKNGGNIIYNGPIGEQSCKVIEYFEKISGVPKMERNSNPATWMMEVTSTSMEAQSNINFASTYQESLLHREMQELVKQLSTPLPNSENLCFSNCIRQNGWGQFKACLWKQNIIYWRSPQYNLNRMVITILIALILGVLYWRHAKILNDEQDLFNVLGSMYMGVIQLGVYSDFSIISFSTTERIIMYHEKFARMYSSLSYSFAQVAIEIPYVFIQVLLYTFIIYPTIGYYWTAYKLIWFFYTTFCSILSYIYVGLLLVSITPNVQVATILGTFFNTMQALFSGFILPAPYGNIDKEIKAFGETKTVAVFLNDYFGFRQDRMGVVAVVITAFPIVLVTLYSIS